MINKIQKYIDIQFKYNQDQIDWIFNNNPGWKKIF